MTTLTPLLGAKLEELVMLGFVTLDPTSSPSTFPTARVVVPVYDSGGTFTPMPAQVDMGSDGQLARHSFRNSVDSTAPRASC